MAEWVTAIIPAYNEADVIAQTVKAAIEIPSVVQVIVVDDASTDNTAETARNAGADPVIVLDHNHGKGGALNAGLGSVKSDFLLLLDADLGRSAVEAQKLVEPVLNGDADMTIGIFGSIEPLESDGLAAKSRGFGTVVKIARFGIKLLTGKTMSAPICGQRALRKEIVDKAGGFSPKFGVEVSLTIDALRMGYRVIEVPVGMVHRASGRDVKGFVHRGAQMINIIQALIRKALKI